MSRIRTLILLLAGLFVSAAANAAPTLSVGSGSAVAGSTVNIPITFNPTTDSVASFQFSLTLPVGISTVSVTAGSILTTANKSISTNLNGNIWTIIIFGLNQDIIPSGTLLTAQVRIAAGTAAGTLSLPVSGLVYSDPSGNPITAGTTTNGSITVLPALPVVSSVGTASGKVGTAFSYQITASNSPTSFNATGLPAGLNVNTGTGLISGTPTTAGSTNVTLSATNAGGTGTKTLALTILPANPVISSSGTATGSVGTAFSYQITASNNPTSFDATGLPAGLTINTGTGLISGTPTTAGTSTVSLSATNSGGTGTKTLTLTVLPPVPAITSAGTATGTVGIAFSYQITASNSPTSFNATGLPAGLAINTATGLISGTPTATGSSTITLSATNAGGTGTKTLTLTVLPPVPAITSAGTATGTVGVAFSYQITASNSPTSFNATGLPAGLTINTVTGLISGTPITAATATITLSATNAGGTGTKTLTLTVLPPVPAITSAGTATGTVGVAFSYQITASNSPTSFNATGLPAGLAINTATGLISGTPTATGSSTITLSATNAGGTGTKTLTLTVLPPVPAITSAGTATGTVGVAFSYQITASNSPTSFNATGLPAGLTINTATGLISGTPTAAGTSTLTLSATNAGGTGTQTLSLTVNPPVPVITSAGTASATQAKAFSYQITASNSPTRFDATGLPAGLTINTVTGLISGTPLSGGVTSIALSATNTGGTGTKTLALTIGSACDLDRDGTTTITDVQLETNQAIMVTACTGDINADSVCNILDVQRIVNAALGGPCVSP